MKKKILYKKINKIFLPILVFVSFFALCFSVMYANADTFVNQDAPFIIQGTATNNNTTIDPVGDVAYLVEKRGHSEVVNGEIVDADGNDLVCIGRQVWNEVSSNLIPSSDNGLLSPSDTDIGSGFIRVIPNRTYYYFVDDVHDSLAIKFYDLDKNPVQTIGWDVSVFDSHKFTTTIDTYYIYFRTVDYGSTYNYNICFSLWYDDEDGYDEYYSYQLLTQVDTGTEVLRSAGNAYDVKTSNGVIVRNIASVDLSTLDWVYYSTTNVWYASVDNLLNNGQGLSDSYTYVYDGGYDLSVGEFSTYYLSFGSAQRIFVNNGSSSVTPTGIVYYEVAIPIQEQGTTFNQVLSVDDFGSMYWLDEDGDLITIPQGNHVTYVYSFVYAWTEPIWRIFPEVFKDLGGNVLKFIKDGFVNLFVNQVEVDGNIEYQPSEISYFVFAILGIALICGLTYYIVNMLRRSR